jgi:O-antigen/teichoic acid export membrane protein
MTAVEPEAHAKPKSWGLILAKNAFSAITGTVVVSLIGFMLTPFLVHQLGNQRFGIWTLIFSIITMTELADFGIGQGVQRYVAQYLARLEYGRVKDLANQGFTMVLLTMSVVSIPLFLLTLFLPVFFKIPESMVQEAQWAMGILILSMMLLVPLSVLCGVISGYQKYELINLNWIVYSLVRAGALVGCVFLPTPLIAMAAILLLLALGRVISLIHVIRKLCPEYVFGLSWPDAHFLSDVAAYGGRLFSISLLGRIIYTADNFLIGLFMAPIYITYYAVGAKWGEIFRMVLSGSIQVCFPAFSHLSAVQDHKSIQDILLNVSRAAMGFGILGASLLILFASPIMLLWMGEGYEPSITIVRWLGIVGVFTSLSFPFEHYLKAVGEVKPLFQATLFNCVMNITCSIFLIKSVGIYGTVWGTLAPLIPTTLILIIPTACKAAGISLTTLFRQLLIPLALPMMWAIGWGVWFHFYPPKLDTLLVTLPWVTLISIGYMALWMMLDPIPRRVLKAFKRNRTSNEA